MVSIEYLQMKNVLIKIRKFMFERTFSVADWWAISLIAALGGWFWLAIIPWILISVRMQMLVEE
jgi:hypothetical protein